MGRAHHVRRERRSRRLSARRPSGVASFGLFVSRVWRGALGVAALLALGTAVLLSAAPAEAQTAVKLVGNTGQTQNNVGAGLHNDFAQAFTTGANAGGYKLTRVDLRLRTSSNISPSYSVKIFSNSSGSPGSSLGTLTNPSSLTGSGSFQNFQFTASSDGIDLAASTTYFVVVALSVEASAVSVGTTLSDSEDTGAAAGWSIANNGLFRAINSTDPWGSSTSARMIAVYGYAKGGTTAKPAKPTDFAATGVELGLRLTWSDPGDSSIVKYQYRISATASWTAWTDIAGSGATTTGYTVEDLPVRDFGTPLRVQVRAVNAVGNGVQSDVVSAAPTLPAIGGLSASPGSDRVTLTWTNPASCAEPLCRYEVSYRVKDGTYRVAIPGFAEANRMEADLDMAGNAIEGAGTIEAASLEVETDLSAGGDLAVTGDLVVGRAVRASGTVEAGETMTASAARISGPASAASMTVTGAVRAQTVEAASRVEAGSIGAAGAVAAGSARLGGLDARSVTARTMTADTVAAAFVTATRVRAGTRLDAVDAGFSRLVVGRCQGCR